MEKNLSSKAKRITFYCDEIMRHFKAKEYNDILIAKLGKDLQEEVSGFVEVLDEKNKEV